MPLALASVSNDVNSNISGIIAFPSLRELKCGAASLFLLWDATGVGISVTWCQWCHQWHHCIPYVTMIKMRCNMTFCSVALILMSCDATSIVNGTTAFLRSRTLKWDVTWHLWSCDTIFDGISIMSWQQHHQWHHCIPWVKIIK